MNNKILIFSALSLAAGAVVSYFVTKKNLEKKYEKKADDEIDHIRKLYLNTYTPKVPKEKNGSKGKAFISKNTIDEAPKVRSEATNYNKKYGNISEEYKSHSVDIKQPPLDRSAGMEKKIYILTPDEYKQSENNVQTLILYKDGVLCDDDFNVIKDAVGTVGPDALKSFGQYEDDSVYVHNDYTELDYEICRDDRTFLQAAPHGTSMVPPDE